MGGKDVSKVVCGRARANSDRVMQASAAGAVQGDGGGPPGKRPQAGGATRTPWDPTPRQPHIQRGAGQRFP